MLTASITAQYDPRASNNNVSIVVREGLECRVLITFPIESITAPALVDDHVLGWPGLGFLRLIIRQARRNYDQAVETDSCMLGQPGYRPAMVLDSVRVTVELPDDRLRVLSDLEPTCHDVQIYDAQAGPHRSFRWLLRQPSGASD